MKKFLILLSFIFTSNCIIQAQWIQTDGPYGGMVYSFAVSDSNLFAGTYGAGVFLSTNSGTNWRAVNNGLENTYINTLTHTGKILFAGTNGNGIFISNNSGANWSRTGFNSNSVYSIIASGNNFFAATNIGVFISTDIGMSWKASGFPYQNVYSLAASGNNLFAGTNNGLFVSTDDGQNWNQVNIGLTGILVFRLKTYGEKIFAGTNSGVLVSNDNGNSWRVLGLQGLGTVNSILVSDNKLFAGTNKGLFRSTDEGSTWVEISSGMTNHYVNALVYFNNKLFAGTNCGVFISKNNGSDWIAGRSGITSSWVHTINISGTNLYAGTEGGVYLSTDNGVSWNLKSNGIIPELSIYALVASDTNLFAGTWGGGVYRSTNKGESWSVINVGLPIQPSSIPGYGSIGVKTLLVFNKNLFAGLTEDGVCLSTNNGASWKKTGLAGTTVNSLFIFGNNIFAGTYGKGIFLSTNNGESWSQLNKGLSESGLFVFAFANIGNNLFAGTWDGVFISSDNGASWLKVNNGLAIRSINTLAAAGKNLIAGTHSDGTCRDGNVYLSTNNGTSWNTISTPITNIPIKSFAVSNNNLFVGTAGAGIWLRSITEYSTSLEKLPVSTLTQFQLDQNYPNPFNPTTVIEFAIPNGGRYTLSIFNVLGELVEVISEKEYKAGYYKETFNAKELSSGIYFYRLTGDQTNLVRKMMLLR